MKHFWQCFLAFGLSLGTTHAQLSTEEAIAIREDLQEPIQIIMKNGRSLPGHSIEVVDGTLKIGTSEGAGEIFYFFQPSQIARFEIPGEHYKSLALELFGAGDLVSAERLFELLYQQRVNLIPYLPASESHFFCVYVQTILQRKNPSKAIGVAKVLRPQVTNPQAIELLEDSILASYHSLQLHEQAIPLAENWIKAHPPYANSALGYAVLAEQALREENYESAMDQALQPIVFGSPVKKAYLADCYAIAISGAIGLREKAYARTLYAEMQERALLWPESNAALQPYFVKLESYLAHDKTK